MVVSTGRINSKTSNKQGREWKDGLSTAGYTHDFTEEATSFSVERTTVVESQIERSEPEFAFLSFEDIWKWLLTVFFQASPGRWCWRREALGFWINHFISHQGHCLYYWHQVALRPLACGKSKSYRVAPLY